MRFLFLTQYFPPEIGAAQTRLGAFASELVRLGHEVEVVTALPNYPTGRVFPEYRGRFRITEEWHGLPVHRVWLYVAMGKGFRRLLNYASFPLTAIFGLARVRKPDYVIVESPPPFLSVPAVLAAKYWRVPLIVNVADLWTDALRMMAFMREGKALRAVEWLERWTYRRATYVNAVTDGIHAALISNKAVPADKVLFLPNGVDTELFHPGPPDEALAKELDLTGRKVLLYAGTHGYSHGIEVALRAASRIKDKTILFLFIGDGSEKPKLLRQAEELGVDNVRFLDPAPPDYVARLYTLSMAGLSTLRLTPLSEGTRPVKVLAAMACGNPVVYSGVGEGARLVENAKAGVVTPPGNADALADAIQTLLADRKRTAEMGRNGRNFVEQHFGCPQLVKNWLSQLARRSER